MPEVRRRRRRRRGPLGRPWRHFRKRLQASPRLFVGLCVAGGLLLLGALWSAWTAWATYADLADVGDEAVVMRAALVRGDADGARKALADYREAAESAESRTSGLTWAVFEAVPVLGDDAEGLATVSSVLADLGRDALPPVVDAADLVTADTFQPRDGVFPVARIQEMEGPALRSEEAFATASAELATVDADDLVGPLRTRVEQLEALVEDARSTLGSTYRAARLIPRMMGQDRPRYYLLVLQNNAELRSGGGLPGALSLVRMQGGKVEIVEQADMAELGNTSSAVDLTTEERRLFGDLVQRAAVNATLLPDFPRAADIIAARWRAKVGGRLDGMIFVDPVAVSYLLQGVGPVAVPGYPAVNAGTVVQAVENQIYLVSDNREAHSNYQQAVSKAVFDAFAAGSGDSVTAIRGLVAAVAEGRVRMHHFDDADQAEIAGTRIAGEFPRTATDRPQVGVYLNDSGPTKMQYYLEYDASLFARSCVGDRQELSGSLELYSNTPADVGALPPAITGATFPGVRVLPGDQLISVFLTTPIGGQLTELSIDGQRVVTPVTEGFADRELARIGIPLQPQSRHQIEFVMLAGPGQEGDIDLAVTPGAQAGSSSGTVPTACIVR